MRRLLILAVICPLLSCDGLFGPGDDGSAVVVSSEEPSLEVVRVTDGRVVARPGPAPPGAYGFARSLDSGFLYYAGSTTYPQRQLLVIDTRSLSVVWNRLLSDLERRSRVPSLELLSIQAIAPSPDGKRLLVSPGRKDGVFGVAVIDGTTGDPVDFVATIMVPADGMAALRASASYPSGAVAVAGSRDQGLGPKSGWIFLFDGDPLTLRDSVQLTQGVESMGGGLGQVVASPDGASLYVLGPGVLLRYDIPTRAVKSVAATVRGRLAVAPDGALYLGDSGDWDTRPSSGILFRYSADLASVDSIDLTAAAVNGLGPTIQGAAPSRDGETVFVLIGNNRVGVGQFPGQPLRILVVDTVRRRIVRSHRLNEWGGGPIFLR